MLALVLSGAANYGAMQAGAAEVLFDAGLQPDMIVGSSAGALNAIYLANDPSSTGARRLQEEWLKAGPDEVGVPTRFTALRRLVTQKDSVIDNAALVAFLKTHLPTGVVTFGALKEAHGVKAFAIAVEMETKSMRAFGDADDDLLLDGALASSAIPPFYPPWEVNGKRYLDGGVMSKLPIMAALERGALQVIALDVIDAMGSLQTANGIFGVSGYALSMMIEVQTATEIAWAKRSGAEIRVIHLAAPVDIPFWDYANAARMVEMGRENARAEIAREPINIRPEWWLRFRRRFGDIRFRPGDYPASKMKE